jgi:hypothetical protein
MKNKMKVICSNAKECNNSYKDICGHRKPHTRMKICSSPCGNSPDGLAHCIVVKNKKKKGGSNDYKHR